MSATRNDHSSAMENVALNSLLARAAKHKWRAALDNTQTIWDIRSGKCNVVDRARAGGGE
jgi:hypothetical protein